MERVSAMSELRNRIRISASVNAKLYEQIKQLSVETQIPISRLFDNAIIALLNSYGKPANQ